MLPGLARCTGCTCRCSGSWPTTAVTPTSCASRFSLSESEIRPRRPVPERRVRNPCSLVLPRSWEDMMTTLEKTPVTIGVRDDEIPVDEEQLAAAAFLARYSGRTLD